MLGRYPLSGGRGFFWEYRAAERAITPISMRSGRQELSFAGNAVHVSKPVRGELPSTITLSIIFQMNLAIAADRSVTSVTGENGAKCSGGQNI